MFFVSLWFTAKITKRSHRFAQFKASGSRFNVLENYETNPNGPGPLWIFIHCRAETDGDSCNLSLQLFTKRSHSRYSCPLVFIRGSNRFLRNEPNVRKKGEREKGCWGERGHRPGATGDFYQTNPPPMNCRFQDLRSQIVQKTAVIDRRYRILRNEANRPGLPCGFLSIAPQKQMGPSGSHPPKLRNKPNSARGSKFQVPSSKSLHQRYPRNPRFK